MNMDGSENWTAVTEWGAFLQQSCKLLRVLSPLSGMSEALVGERKKSSLWDGRVRSAAGTLWGISALHRKHTNQRTAEFTWHHLRSCCSPIEHTERRGEGRNRAALLSAQCGQTGKMCDSYTAGVLYPGGAKTGGYILQTCRASVTVQSGTPSPACSRAPLPLKLIIGGSTVSSCLSSSLRNISSSVKF